MSFDPYRQPFDATVFALRHDFGVMTAIRSRRSHVVITGVTDVSEPPWPCRRLYSQFTLGERELHRDRRRHGKADYLRTARGGIFMRGS